MLTDMYQISMTYAHWRSRRTEDQAVFDLFFRKNPFDGEYTVFAGQDEVVKFLNSFQFTDSDIEYLKVIQFVIPRVTPSKQVLPIEHHARM